MTFYKAIISYIGSDYFGWQVQPNARTIQWEVNKSLAVINQCQLSEIKTMGSGRTDAGVHAIILCVMQKLKNINIFSQLVKI